MVTLDKKILRESGCCRPFRAPVMGGGTSNPGLTPWAKAAVPSGLRDPGLTPWAKAAVPSGLRDPGRTPLAWSLAEVHEPCVWLYLTAQPSLDCGAPAPLSFADGVRACRSPRIDSHFRSAGKQSGAGAPHSTDRARGAARYLSRSNRPLGNADLCQTSSPGREPWGSTNNKFQSPEWATESHPHNSQNSHASHVPLTPLIGHA